MPNNETDVEVLDCYIDVFNDKQSDAYLIWGGRDKGASDLIAQRLLLDCIEDDYFRCVLVRKTYESIKGSQWQTLKDVAEREGISQFFKFQKSPLEVYCTVNNNFFIARGCDNPDKLKSLKDVNVCWIEETDQITEDDYVVVHTTLRHSTARIRQWMSFNSDLESHKDAKQYQDHWLWKYYLEKIPNTYKEGIYETLVDVPLPNGDTQEEVIKFYSHHGTYRQNPYCPAKRAAIYESYQENNPYYYTVYTLGRLGNKENKNPFFYSFDKSKHYKAKLYEIDKRYHLDFSFDFNFEPCTCVVGQFIPHKQEYHIIRSHYASATDHKSSLEMLCDELKEYFKYVHYSRIRVTGDAAGKQRGADTAANVNKYVKIMRYLGLGSSSVLKVERSNIDHKSSRDLCNDVLKDIPITFYSGTEQLIENIQASYPDAKGTLNDCKKKLGVHDVDCFRYLLKFWFAFELNGKRFKEYQNRIRYIKIIKSKVS